MKLLDFAENDCYDDDEQQLQVRGWIFYFLLNIFLFVISYEVALWSSRVLNLVIDVQICVYSYCSICYDYS